MSSIPRLDPGHALGEQAAQHARTEHRTTEHHPD
jgi:hypothetical protein